MTEDTETYFEAGGVYAGIWRIVALIVFGLLIYINLFFRLLGASNATILLFLLAAGSVAYLASPMGTSIRKSIFPKGKHALITLNADSLIVDKPKHGAVPLPGFTSNPKGKDTVPLKELQSATYYGPGKPSELFMAKYPASNCGTGGIVLKYNDFERFRPIEDQQKFMHSLADRMQRAGIGIAIAGSTEKIAEITNLDLHKNH
jgi:hypothetical protein